VKEKKIDKDFSWFQMGTFFGFVIATVMIIGLIANLWWVILIPTVLGAIALVSMLEREVEERVWVLKEFRRLRRLRRKSES